MTENPPADLVKISDEYSEGYDVEGDYDDDGECIPYSGGSIAGTGDVTYRLDGRTRKLVLQKAGKTDGLVTVVESHRDGGYCVTCSFEYLVFVIRVDGETVYESGMDESDNPFGFLQEWLTGPDGTRHVAALEA